MHQRNFESNANMLSTITKEKLEKAASKENNHLPISDPAVKLLLQHVHAIGLRVQGSDQLRTQWRSKIWSTSIAKGPITIWATINPLDLHDLIA